MKSDLIQQIGELVKKGELKQAVDVAKQLHQSFPDDAECGDIYAGILHKLATQLEEANSEESLKQGREHINTAIQVAVSEEVKESLQEVKDRLQEKRNALDGPTPEPPDEARVTTERAVKMLKGGVPGIEAWNLFRQCESYVPTLQGADLSGRNLSGANLVGVDLSQSTLTKAILYNVRLHNTIVRTLWSVCGFPVFDELPNKSGVIR